MALGVLADWHGPASAEAISLARAIEVAMNGLFGPELPVGVLTWSILVFKSLDGLGREFVKFPCGTP